MIKTNPREFYPGLSPREAEVYYYHIDKKMQHKDVAEKLGINIRTSETLYSRALKKIEKMRRTLENLDDVYNQYPD